MGAIGSRFPHRFQEGLTPSRRGHWSTLPSESCTVHQCCSSLGKCPSKEAANRMEVVKTLTPTEAGPDPACSWVDGNFDLAEQ